MNSAQLTDEIITLIIAGHETTAAALAWTWDLLGRHADFQDVLAKSVATLPPNGTLTLENLENWREGQQLIMESLRLYPPGWLLSRRCLRPHRIGGAQLLANSDLLLGPYFLHRNPKHWSNPEQFDPSRFDDAQACQRNKFAYIPFGAGPRRCIGESLAMCEMATHFLTMTPRFRLTPTDDTPPEVEARVTLRPRSDLKMRINQR